MNYIKMLSNSFFNKKWIYIVTVRFGSKANKYEDL